MACLRTIRMPSPTMIVTSTMAATISRHVFSKNRGVPESLLDTDVELPFEFSESPGLRRDRPQDRDEDGDGE